MNSITTGQNIKIKNDYHNNILYSRSLNNKLFIIKPD